MDGATVARITKGVYRVDHDGRNDIVYIAGPPDDRWAFWNGHVFRSEPGGSGSRPRRGARARGAQSLAAPMPATIIKVLVEPGGTVKKGDPVVLLEAMKMELPIHAPSDATVTAVRCRQGDLVQAGATLVELE